MYFGAAVVMLMKVEGIRDVAVHWSDIPVRKSALSRWGYDIVLLGKSEHKNKVQRSLHQKIGMTLYLACIGLI